MKTRVLAIVVAVVLIAGCGDDAGSEEASTTTLGTMSRGTRCENWVEAPVSQRLESVRRLLREARFPEPEAVDGEFTEQLQFHCDRNPDDRVGPWFDLLFDAFMDELAND